MSALDRIAVKVVNAAELPTGNARALVNELAVLLEAWVTRGTPASIDLRSLPLTAGDYDELRATLRTGAVSARVEAIGATDVRETQYPGVWWVTHYNETKEIVADLIEVCEVPAILRAPVEDAAEGLARLQASQPE